MKTREDCPICKSKQRLISDRAHEDHLLVEQYDFCEACGYYYEFSYGSYRMGMKHHVQAERQPVDQEVQWHWSDNGKDVQIVTDLAMARWSLEWLNLVENRALAAPQSTAKGSGTPPSDDAS